VLAAGTDVTARFVEGEDLCLIGVEPGVVADEQLTVLADHVRGRLLLGRLASGDLGQVALVGGDQDLPRVLPDAADLRAAIQARGGSVELFVEPNADHFAANRSFMTRDGIVARAVIQMMQR